jgi:hypothetical protein
LAHGTIENPIINSPFVEPVRHFLTTSDGTVRGEIDERRRLSKFFVPVAPPKKKSAGQLTLDAFGGPKRQQPSAMKPGRRSTRTSPARSRAQSPAGSP